MPRISIALAEIVWLKRQPPEAVCSEIHALFRSAFRKISFEQSHSGKFDHYLRSALLKTRLCRDVSTPDSTRVSDHSKHTLDLLARHVKRFWQ